MASYFEVLSRKMQGNMTVEQILAEVTRDPTQPKRPPTAFLLHNRQYRSVLKAQKPKEKVTVQALAHHWNHEILATEKEKLVTEAKELKTEYNKLMVVYRERKARENNISAVSAVAVSSSRKRKKRNKDRDPLKPKNPQSAFLAHNAKYRPILKLEHPGVSGKEMFKLLGAHWNSDAISAEKKEFKIAAGKRKDAYKIELAAYELKKASKPVPAPVAIVAPATGSAKKKKMKSEDAVAAGTTFGTTTPANSGKKHKKKRKKSSKKKKKQQATLSL